MQISFRSVSGENIKNIIENDYTINSACCYLGQKLKINPNQVFILNPSKNSKFIYSNCHVIKYSQLQSNKNYLFFRMEGFDSNESTTFGCANMTLDKTKFPIKNIEKLYSNFKQIKNIGRTERFEYRSYAKTMRVTQSNLQNKIKDVLHIGYDINDYKEIVIKKINDEKETKLYHNEIDNINRNDNKIISLNEKPFLFNSSDNNDFVKSSLSPDKIKPFCDSSNNEKNINHFDGQKVHDFIKKDNFINKANNSSKPTELSYNKKDPIKKKLQLSPKPQPPPKQQNYDEPKITSNQKQKSESTSSLDNHFYSSSNDKSTNINQNNNNRSQKKSQFSNDNNDSINSINNDKKQIKTTETKIINKNIQENPKQSKQSKMQNQDEFRKKSQNHSHRRSSSVKSRSHHHHHNHTDELKKPNNNHNNDQKTSLIKSKTNDTKYKDQNLAEKSIQCSINSNLKFTKTIVIFDEPPQKDVFKMNTNHIFDSNRHKEHQPRKKKIVPRHHAPAYQPIQIMNPNSFIQNQQNIQVQAINFSLCFSDHFTVVNMCGNFQGYVINQRIPSYQQFQMFQNHDEINRNQIMTTRRGDMIGNSTPNINQIYINNYFINQQNPFCNHHNARHRRSCSCHHKSRDAHESNLRFNDYDDFY